MNNKHTAKYADLGKSTLFPYIAQFLKVMRNRGVYTADTAKGVRSTLNDLAAEFGARPMNRFGPAFVEEWMGRPMAPNTKRNRLSHVRRFGGWLVDIGKLKANPTREYPTIRIPRRVPVTCPQGDVAKLFDLVAGDRRATAIVWLMVGQGCRCIEVAQLMVDDYDPEGRTILLRGKGGHERLLPVPTTVAQALDAYLDEAGRVPGPLIRSKVDGYSPISRCTLSDYLSRWMTAAGIKARNYDGKSAHGLRRTAASDVMDHTRDIQLVQAMLGHAKIETTTIYLRPVPLDLLRAGMEGRTYAPSTEATDNVTPIRRSKGLHSYHRREQEA